MVDKPIPGDKNQTEDQEDAEASRYWNEAVSVRQDGKEAPVEGVASEPVEETPEPAAEPETEAPAEVPDDAEQEEAEETDDTGGEEEEPEASDPWDGVPETVRTEFNDYKSKAEKLEHEARSNRGRMGAMQKEINELSRKLEAATKKDEPPAAAADPGDSLFNDDKWKRFKEDFGDVADPIESTMRGLYQALHSRLQDTDRVSQELISAEEQRKYAAEATALDEQWPGWRQFIEDNRDDFDSFVVADDVANDLFKANETTLKSAAKGKALLVLFKNHLDAKTPKSASNGATPPKPEPRELTPKRKQQLKSAATVAPRSHPAPGRRSDDLPDPDEYDASFRYFQELATR